MAARPPAARVNGRLGEAALVAAGEDLGARLPRGAVVWLEGELGAGKTTLARAIARGRGVAGGTSSPTYDLVHRYEGPGGPVFHVDAYRLRHPDEAADLDWSELAGGDLLLIEWPERVGAWAPPATVRIRLEHDADEQLRVARLS